MTKYKYRIIGMKKQWRFDLLPNNSNTQYVACSGIYDSFDKARSGIDSFKHYMKNIEKEENPNIEIVDVSSGKTELWIGYMYFSNCEKVETRKHSKYETEKALVRVKNNFMANFRQDLCIEKELGK